MKTINELRAAAQRLAEHSSSRPKDVCELIELAREAGASMSRGGVIRIDSNPAARGWGSFAAHLLTDDAMPFLMRMVWRATSAEAAHGYAIAENERREREAARELLADRPRWATDAVMQAQPATDDRMALAAQYAAGLRGEILRRLADTEVALAHARAEIVALKAKAILSA